MLGRNEPHEPIREAHEWASVGLPPNVAPHLGQYTAPSGARFPQRPQTCIPTIYQILRLDAPSDCTQHKSARTHGRRSANGTRSVQPGQSARGIGIYASDGPKTADSESQAGIEVFARLGKP